MFLDLLGFVLSPSLCNLLPHNCIFTGFIFSFPFHAKNLHAASAEWCRNPNFNFLCKQCWLKVGFYNNLDRDVIIDFNSSLINKYLNFHFSTTNVPNQRNHSEWQTYVFGCPIPSI